MNENATPRFKYILGRARVGQHATWQRRNHQSPEHNECHTYMYTGQETWMIGGVHTKPDHRRLRVALLGRSASESRDDAVLAMSSPGFTRPLVMLIARPAETRLREWYRPARPVRVHYNQPPSGMV